MRTLHLLTPSCAITSPCAHSAFSALSTHKAALCVLNTPLCALSATLCPIPAPPPYGVKVINSTIATPRPLDYSSLCGLLYFPWISYLQCIVLPPVFSAHCPVDYLTLSWINSALTCVQCSPSCRLLYFSVDYLFTVHSVPTCVQ